ncbi:transmembrane protein 39A-like [Uloborus diversus]|uniref:transmembrane protein 39A-like n=1 Tax=Uloborus diversus TaxID=327109 RepID=UPI0024096CF7|nr:transmembrane protein 39A-like [Uloborus diversus]
MPGGRRNAKSSSFKHHAHSSDDRHSCEMPTQPQVIQPKHIPIPDLPPSSDLFFEIDAFAFCLLAMASQYINLYRSFFWLPFAYNENALNYYLIDYHVLIINMVMVGRRLPICFLKQVLFFCLPSSSHSSCAFCIRIATVVMLTPLLIYCVYHVVLEHGITSIVVLSYPAAVYLVAFGPTIYKFLELKSPTHERNTGARSKNPSNGKNITTIAHVCSMSAETIRDEVEFFKNDFNARLKQVIFNSLLVVYHTAFLPCYFVQNTLYYEVRWAAQHAIFVAVSCFTLYASHCFPSRYCDVLHKAALHLGRWQKVEIKNVHVPYSTWSESSMFNQGALVKHSKELFKAEGISNAAEPGHAAQSRFYAVFKNPSVVFRCLWITQILLIISQMIVLLQSRTWNDLISIQLLLLMSCKTLYGMTKVYFVIRKIYYEEKMLISRANS